MRHYLAIFLFGLVNLASDCRHTPPHKPVVTLDVAGACANGWDNLKCKSMGPTPAGVPCTTWLAESPVSGAYVTCVAQAIDCSVVDGCRL